MDARIGSLPFANVEYKNSLSHEKVDDSASSSISNCASAVHLELPYLEPFVEKEEVESQKTEIDTPLTPGSGEDSEYSSSCCSTIYTPQGSEGDEEPSTNRACSQSSQTSAALSIRALAIRREFWRQYAEEAPMGYSTDVQASLGEAVNTLPEIKNSVPVMPALVSDNTTGAKIQPPSRASDYEAQGAAASTVSTKSQSNSFQQSLDALDTPPNYNNKDSVSSSYEDHDKHRNIAINPLFSMSSPKKPPMWLKRRF